MRLKHLLAVGVSAALLSGCAVYNAQNLDSIEATAGNDFTRALTVEYKGFARSEVAEGDWIDAEHFANKAKATASGRVAAPEQLSDWDLPADKTQEIADARANLVSILDASARSKMPDLAARAQARLDCWIEQQEEGHQANDIQACRQAFRTAYNQLRAGMQADAPEAEPAPAVTPEADVQESWTVTFAFDSAQVDEQARGIIRKAAQAARDDQAVDLVVTGYTDSTGTDAYNQALSLRRAEAVRDVLVEMGVAEDRIGVAARGKTRPAIERGDQVRERANRRVVIDLL
ncbi:OmpA family protein [Rhodovibrio sodomensis]|nr:OmpA family protein [Rhodovibrio sodomensis]